MKDLEDTARTIALRYLGEFKLLAANTKTTVHDNRIKVECQVLNSPTNPVTFMIDADRIGICLVKETTVKTINPVTGSLYESEPSRCTEFKSMGDCVCVRPIEDFI